MAKQGILSPRLLEIIPKAKMGSDWFAELLDTRILTFPDFNMAITYIINSGNRLQLGVCKFSSL